MKVYVDELPKSCAFCPCYDCELGCCDISDVDLYIYENFNRYKQIHKDCPLQTISDHDKQVRKQVCSEIGGEIYTQMIVYGKELRYSDLNLILDKIEKGELCERI